ncbi:MAG: MerR family transcriptional regulator [Nocardioides sp.]|nr:MerR family transcriptional regulator [Nocardioides sp.]
MTATNSPDDLCRIGDLAERTGVSSHTLRAWEKRFSLLRPVRTSGGYRLYSQADAARVTRMQELRDQGVAAARAAAMVLQEDRGRGHDPADGAHQPGDVVAAFVEQARAFDDAGAHAVLDAATSSLSTEDAIEQVFLPALSRIGEGWADGELTVAHEHFASLVVRARLMPHTVAWSTGTGPLAVLACPAGERHDIGLIAFGVVLGRAGWQVRCLGADTPWESLVSAVEALEPDVLVLSAVTPAPLEPLGTWLPRLGAARRVVVGGAGAANGVPDGVEVLLPSLVESAARLAAHR